MKSFLCKTLCYLAIFFGAQLAAPLAFSASLEQINDFGNNPGNLDMHLYVPDNVQSAAPVLLAVHYCTGSGPEFFQNTRYNELADTHGFIVIYPSATRSSQCFDVYSSGALTRDGGSDPVSLNAMIDHVKNSYNVDSQRIYVTGTSSGAMMTNVMLALYPDVFNAGAAFAGVPYQCFATSGGSEWNSECSGGNISRSAQEWGDAVRSAYPDYGGSRPRVQLWHGTEDDTLSYNNFEEAIKQWTNVHGLSLTPDQTDSPASNTTRTRYGDSGDNALVEAISLQGVGHNLPVDEDEVIRFFNLDDEAGAPTSSSSSGASEPVSEQCEEMCQWYQDAPRPLCENQNSGWGWENQQSCIGRMTCNDQYGDGGVISSCTAGSSSSSSSSLSSSQPSSSSSVAVPSSSSSAAPVDENTITIRMEGITGDESVSLEVGGEVIQTWTLSTNMDDYSVSTNASGEVRVAFTNDSGDRDVRVDYVDLDGDIRYAEDQEDNTGAWDGECGAGSYSQLLHCNGSIGFGNFNGGGSPSSSESSSTSSTNNSSSNSSSSAPGPSTGVENSGSHCDIPALASFYELPSIDGLPNPFQSIDGSTISSADDWTCRRAEISAQAQRYELGEKPAPLASVSGSANGSGITVNVQQDGQSIQFQASIDLPTSGQAPYPAVIGMGGSSLNNSALRSQGVAVITFPNNEIASQASSGSRGQGKFYDLYGSNHSAGAMAAWAWGVSRLIDALEETPGANIDASKLGVTGCSRNGKGALIAGALDERVALTIPQESGSGGSAAWRVSDAQQSQGQNVQTLSQIVTENVWFRESFSEFGNSADRLPFDHHSVMGLVAPRGLLVLENTDMEWLGNESTYTASVVAREIWEALGVPQNMGVSQQGGYSHCQFPSSQQAVLDAFVARFLLDSSAGNTDVIRTDGNITVDFNRWVDWQTPSLQ